MMGRFAVGVSASLLAAMLVLPVGCSSGPKFKFDAPYDNFRSDLDTMRQTQWDRSQAANVNTEEAVEAAQRVFEFVPFVGMTRDELIHALGNPATVNDWGVKVPEGENAPLVYVFHDGEGGVIYTIMFEDDIAYDMEREFVD